MRQEDRDMNDSLRSSQVEKPRERAFREEADTVKCLRCLKSDR